MKIVPQLDTYPRLVSFGQTALGKAALLGAFAWWLLVNRLNTWIEITVAVALMAYFPARRRLLASIGALYWLFFHSTWLNWTFLRELAKAEGQRTDWTLTVLVSGILAAVFCVLAIFFHYVRARRGSLAAKRPVLCLMAGYALVLAAAGLLPLGGMTRLLVWGAIAVTAPYLWYFAYALKDALAKTPDDAILQFGTLQPFWGGSNVPYAKGASNLRRIEARNSVDLSITQLKAIKLLMWVFILRMLLLALQVFVYGDPASQGLQFIGLARWGAPNLGVPELEAALQHAAVLPVHVAWASVIAHFAQGLLNLTVSGNIVIACCRMAGFYALRNTYRPLEARTVAEFWNRYYYYFKELLVEFFFFPVFTRYLKQYRRFRLFAATMAAATVGNMVYHLLRDYGYVARMGLWRALVGFQVYAFYATALGLGIGISQLRGHGRERSRGDAQWWRRALATAGVLSFFCLLEIFDQEGRSYGLGLYVRFFLRLFLIPV
ncbi:MAG: hypothetical protein ABSF62_10410 [Bryobacteraceae bacterium]